jgi:hypothetical protein
MMMTFKALAAGLWAAAFLCGAAQAQSTAAAPAKVELDAHAKKDIQRHRAMAKAHEDAARCLESGTPEAACQKTLLAACRGLAIGKYCGLKHEH